MPKILILEDDILFNETLEDFLEEENFVVNCVLDPYSALDLTYTNKYDLYLFDVNLPYENGFELLDKLRKSGDMTPTIFITSRADKDSLREGFMKGADDYIYKPVDLEELLLRIIALLRRQTRSEYLTLGVFQFDVITKRLYKDKMAIELSQKATELLLVLIEGQEQIVSNQEIKERLWSASEEESAGALRVYITQLKKIFPNKIKNIRGVGYQMIR
jgi:DNA-binding response OmpR family regulator